MLLFRTSRNVAQRWPTDPVISVPVWHAVGAGVSITVATVGVLASFATHETHPSSLLYYPTTVVVLVAVWTTLRHVPGRWPLFVWPLAMIAGLAIAAAVAPTSASLCVSTIVLGFLFAGLTQPRGSSLLLVVPALLAYRLVYSSLPLDQMLVKMPIAALVWVAATELPAWLTVKLRFARAELARLAATDPLTGLANRRYWDEHLSGLLERGPRPAVLLMDLDHFKRFNDERGHLAGDELLIAFARMLEQAVPAGEICARWGGEEFAVVLRHAAHAERVAEEIRRNVPWEQTCSIGLVIHRSGEDATALIHRADQALYLAKAGGRDRVVAA